MVLKYNSWYYHYQVISFYLSKESAAGAVTEVVLNIIVLIAGLSLPILFKYMLFLCYVGQAFVDLKWRHTLVSERQRNTH